jgi:hypothetical protein
MAVQFDALALHPALVRIGERWGPIAVDELASFLGEQDHVDPELAAALARAFDRLFRGDVEGAIYTAVPRLEALARNLVLAGGLPAYKTQRETAPGQYPGLGALVRMLGDAGLDESWVRYLKIFSGVTGENIRNELLHGFVAEPPDVWATLIFVGALFLALHVQARR